MKLNIQLSDLFADKRTLNQIFLFLGLVLTAIVFWVVFTNFLQPPKTVVEDNLIDLTQTISSYLDGQALELMSKKTYLPSSKLEDFAIYLVNSKINYNSDVLELRSFEPSVPFDLSYYSLSEANLAR